MSLWELEVTVETLLNYFQKCHIMLSQYNNLTDIESVSTTTGYILVIHLGRYKTLAGPALHQLSTTEANDKSKGSSHEPGN